MPQSIDPTDPQRIAAAIAPIIDRLRLAVVAALGPALPEIAERTNVPPPALMASAMLRNTMPDRVVAIDDVLDVFAYQPAEQVRGSIAALTAGGLLETAGDDQVRLAPAGRSLINELYERSQSFVDSLWAGQAELVTTLLPTAQRACAAVPETGGAATRVMAPPYEPAGASPALLLAETLTLLRFHRFDAHLAAWRAAGLTAEQVQKLEPGAERQRIEDETNRRAARPYEALSDDERFTLCTGLGALPN